MEDLGIGAPASGLVTPGTDCPHSHGAPPLSSVHPRGAGILVQTTGASTSIPPHLRGRTDFGSVIGPWGVMRCPIGAWSRPAGPGGGPRGGAGRGTAEPC